MTNQQKAFCKAVYAAACALYLKDKDNCVSPLFNNRTSNAGEWLGQGCYR